VVSERAEDDAAYFRVRAAPAEVARLKGLLAAG
jgi:hypothetical protein